MLVLKKYINDVKIRRYMTLLYDVIILCWAPLEILGAKKHLAPKCIIFDGGVTNLFNFWKYNINEIYYFKNQIK